MTESFETLEEVMAHAVSLAARGVGHVEPNPAVGAVVIDSGLRVLGEGWHGVFGGPHAEVEALAAAALGIPVVMARIFTVITAHGSSLTIRQCVDRCT